MSDYWTAPGIMADPLREAIPSARGMGRVEGGRPVTEARSAALLRDADWEDHAPRRGNLPFRPQPSGVMDVPGSAPPRYSTLRRGGPIKRTTPLRAKRRSDDYGGPKAAAFRLSIKERDGFTCQWCRKSSCLPLHVHHLKRVGMGGSKTANRPENAITLGAPHHRSHHEGYEPTRQQLLDRMVNLGHIVLLTEPELDETDARLGIGRVGSDSLFEQDDERDGWTPGLTATDGRR